MEDTPGRSHSTPRDIFAHLLATIMLYAGVASLIALLFQYINAFWPDPVAYSSFQSLSDIIRRSAAALLVVWPVYLYLLWMISRDAVRDPEKRELKIRKWLFNLTLFVAAVTIIVDLITLLHSFFGGELTWRFVLKIAVVLIVAAAVLGYYRWDLRRAVGVATKLPQLAAGVTAAVALVSIVAGFFIIGSPFEQRALRFDERRVNDLQTIQGQVLNYWVQKTRLPHASGELEDSISGFKVPRDPETNSAYEYSVMGATQFRLCATFSRASQEQSGLVKPVAPAEPFGQNWQHDAGRVCFDRTIDPELYKKEGGVAPLAPPVSRPIP